MTVNDWLIFSLIWLMAGLPVGPNAINCILVSSKFGFIKSLYAVLGILVASVLYMTLVFSGLSTLLLANEQLFTLIRLAGASYLIWMGLKLLFLGKPASLKDSHHIKFNAFGTTRDAMLISLSNPKAMLSYGAVLSQFISTEASLLIQISIMAPTVLAITALVYTGYALFGRGASTLLKQPNLKRRFDQAVGSFYIVAGLLLIFSENNRAKA